MTEVTHNWGNRFSHLVRALEESFKLSKMAEPQVAAILADATGQVRCMAMISAVHSDSI